MVEQLVSLGATHEKRNFNCVIVLDRFLFSLLSIVKKVIRMRFWGRHFILQVELVSFRLPHKQSLSVSDSLTSGVCLFETSGDCLFPDSLASGVCLFPDSLTSRGPWTGCVTTGRADWRLAHTLNTSLWQMFYYQCFLLILFERSIWHFILSCRGAFCIVYLHIFRFTMQTHFALYTCVYSNVLWRCILYCSCIASDVLWGRILHSIRV